MTIFTSPTVELPFSVDQEIRAAIDEAWKPGQPVDMVRRVLDSKPRATFRYMPADSSTTFDYTPNFVVPGKFTIAGVEIASGPEADRSFRQSK